MLGADKTPGWGWQPPTDGTLSLVQPWRLRPVSSTPGGFTYEVSSGHVQFMLLFNQ